MRDFRNTLTHCGLMEIAFEGYNYEFTWENNHEEDTFIESRLDRATASQGWFSIFPSAKVYHLHTDNSDHMPLHLRLNPVSARRYKNNRRRFRFESMWLRSSDLHQVIRDS